MSRRPAISVVVTCHNLARTVEAAVDSALEQTRVAHEVIVVDDGSTDILTRQVLDRLRRPRTTVVLRGHQGVAAARNHGLALTRTPYLVLLDGDDVLTPTYLEALGEQLDADCDISFVSCAVQAFEGASYRWKPPATTVVATLARGSVHVSTMFRRSLWEAVGGFDPSLPGYEDLDFWLHALRRGFRGKVLDEPLLQYRVRRESRYRQAIGAASYARTIAMLFDRHRAVIETHGLALLEEKQAFLLEIAAHHEHLRKQRDALRRAIAAHDGESGAPSSFRSNGRSTTTDLNWVPWADSSTRSEFDGFLQQCRWRLRGRILLVSDAPWALESIVPPRWDVRAENDADALRRARTDELGALPEGAYDCVVALLLRPDGSLNEQIRRLATKAKSGGTLLLATTALAPCSVLESHLEAPPADTWLRSWLAGVFPVTDFDVATRADLVTACVIVESRPRGRPPLLLAPARVADAIERRGLVLAYHRIASLEPDSFRLCTSINTFRAHLEYLTRHCVVMPLPELVDRAGARRLPPRAVALTFDDGYVDALTTVAPLLRQAGLPATFFVNSFALTTEHEDWHDQIENLILGHVGPREGLNLDADVPSVLLPLTTSEERRRALQLVHGAFMTADPSARRRMLANLRRVYSLSPAPRAERRLLTASQVRELFDIDGMEIGSHSANHLLLPRHARDVQRTEVSAAKEALENLLDTSVVSFAYPFGQHDAGLCEIVRQTPTMTAVTTEPGWVTADTDPMRVPRVEVGRLTAAAFADLLDRAFSSPAADIQAVEFQISGPGGSEAAQSAEHAWETNDRRSRLEAGRLETILTVQPQFLIVDPTSRCNARCVMCPVSFRPRGDRGTDLGWPLFEKLSPLFPTASQINLFSSGEPTLEADLPRMIEQARLAAPAGSVVWVSTNGKRLPAAFLESVMRPGVGLQFSVDGGSREVFELVRRGIRFEELRHSLDSVRQRKGALSYPKLAFSSTMSKRNLRDLTNIFALAREYGVEHVHFYDEDPEVVEEEAFVLEPCDRPAFNEQLPLIDAMGISYSNGLTFRGAAGLRATNPEPTDAAPAIHCLAPWKVFHQRADGTVRTCCTLRTSMGNTRLQSVDEIWNGEAYVRLRRAFSEQRGIPATCYRCTDPLRTFGAEP